jgi:hypothetical protein
MDVLHPLIRWLIYLGLLEVFVSALLVGGLVFSGFLIGKYLKWRNRLDNG